MRVSSAWSVGAALLGCLSSDCSINGSKLSLPPSSDPVAPAPSGPFDTLAYVQRAWKVTGRSWLARYTGVQWDPASSRWRLDEQWPYAPDDVAQQAYYAEYALRPALNLAIATHDVDMLDELASFYETFLPRFTTLGALRARAGVMTSAALLDDQGRDSQRTMAWLEKTLPRARIRECSNCNAQFLHPASRLLRAIALLPEARRTTAMKRFAAAYRPLLVDDLVIRFGFEARPIAWGNKGLPSTLVATWDALAGAPTPVGYQRAMTDRDLWLVAVAAEVLGAAAADSLLVPLGSSAVQLRQLVGSGVRFFQASRSVRADTRDFNGAVVGSASYFRGDLADHPDQAYSGYQGARFPTPADRRSAPDASWDVSHAYRIPVFLRSLADTRQATGTTFPTDADVRLAVNEYVYRAFDGDFAHPLFHNYLDGTDGWYRVSYAGRTGTGYPPSADCDTRISGRPCLSRGALMGWGLLSSWSPDLRRVLRSVITLATSNDADAVAFRARYYGRGEEALALRDASGREVYPFLLFGLLAETLTAVRQ